MSRLRLAVGGVGSAPSLTTSSSPPPQSICLSRLAVGRVDEVVAALADEGVGAEVAEEAVVAVVADQHVGAVGALEALVVGEELVGVAAARRGRRCRRGCTRRAVVGAGVGDGVVAGAAVEACGPGRSTTEETSRSSPGPPLRLSAPGSA